jgi:hypothetical protein
VLTGDFTCDGKHDMLTTAGFSCCWAFVGVSRYQLTDESARLASAIVIQNPVGSASSFLTVVAPIRSVPKILTVAPTLPELVCALTKGPSPIDKLKNPA